MGVEVKVEVSQFENLYDECHFERDSVLAPSRNQLDKTDAENDHMRQYTRENPFQVATCREVFS